MGYAYGGSLFRERQTYEWVVETSNYVRESSQGIGVGLGLYTSLINCLKELQFSKASGLIAVPNEPSRKLHGRLGCKHEATLSKIGWQHDTQQNVEVWTLQLNILPPSTITPVHVDNLIKSERLDKSIKSGEIYITGQLLI